LANRKENREDNRLSRVVRMLLMSERFYAGAERRFSLSYAFKRL
jgi:hypothetical protein